MEVARKINYTQNMSLQTFPPQSANVLHKESLRRIAHLTKLQNEKFCHTLRILITTRFYKRYGMHSEECSTALTSKKLNAFLRGVMHRNSVHHNRLTFLAGEKTTPVSCGSIKHDAPRTPTLTKTLDGIRNIPNRHREH
jgi:hypothetical protein